MNKNCSNCKHWGDGWPVTENTKTAACGKVDIDGDKNNVQSFYMDISVSDDSGLNVNLITGKDFGCIHFTQK